MSPEGWERVCEVFNSVLELEDDDERDRFLAEVCAGDAEMRVEVESLLESHDLASTFLPDLRQEETAPGVGASSDPERIGPYLIEE